MPEGDTLRKIAEFMQPRMVGQLIVDASLGYRRVPEITRRTVVDVCALGKHLLITLSPQGPQGWLLRVHLGMFGSWHVYHSNEAWKRPRRQAQVTLNLGNEYIYVCFNPQDVELVRPSNTIKDASKKTAKLGPNLLDELPDMARISKNISRCDGGTLIIDMLLNQQVAAGLGNVYKSELMFLQRLGVQATLATTDAATIQKTYALGVTLLQQNLGGWPRTTTHDRRCTYRPELPRLWVYGRAQKPCLVCQTSILRACLGRMRRSTYWCPSCQKAAPRDSLHSA